jgi:hypothetical protein
MLHVCIALIFGTLERGHKPLIRVNLRGVIRNPREVRAWVVRRLLAGPSTMRCWLG